MMESSSFDRKGQIHHSTFSIFNSKFSIHTAVFAFFVGVAVQYAGAKHGGTNAPPNGASPPNGNVELKMENVELRNLSPLIENEQFHNSPFYILHSQLSPQFPFRLESVATNDSYSYAMPTNGTRYARWWKRGGYEDVFRLDLDGMIFPLGTNLCSSLWVYTWGMAGAHLADASNRIAATGVPMSAVPFASQFWSAALPDGARRLTWQDFALNRDTNTPVSAQLDLYPSGDFVARSNLVETVYRRVNPDDWDDDGYPNGIDPNPYAFDEGGFGPHQELPQGANPNAYCWVDIVVPNANALVTFVGDAPCALPDPRFIARAGETNRVTVLIGKTYTVTCNMPISCVDKSSFDIDVWQNSPTELYICWPVTIEAVGMRSGSSFSMSVWPDCLGGSFTWTNSCCSISSSDGVFTYSCNDACHCTGCAAMGYYGYESYRLPAYGGSCGCSSYGEYDERPYEEDYEGPYDAGASAVFSKSAVIFEDGYWNTPTNWVERQSTQTELHCVAHGGPNGGHVRFEILGEDKLERVSGHVLPVEQDVGPGKKIDFTIVYKGQLPSSTAEDIIVTTTFTENVQGATPSSSQSKITSVKVELETVYEALGNSCPHRHEYGVGEKVKFTVSPSVSGALMQVEKADSGDNITVYDTFGGELSVSAGGMHVYTCPASGTVPDITISVADAEYFPIMTIVEPQYVVTPMATRTGSFWPGDVVMGTLCTSNHIGPMSVSFQGVKVFEVPCSNAVPPVGYFSTTNFDGNLTHTLDAGAGWVHRIGVWNYWMVDEAGRSVPYPNWSEGHLTWKIPIGWKRLTSDDDNAARADKVDYAHYKDSGSRPLLIGNREDAYTQIFLISENGTSFVEKFGHRLTRSRWSIFGEVINTQ